MKKSRAIKLVIIGTALSACNSSGWESDNKLHVRSDTTGNYTTGHHVGMGYYHFYPFGVFNSYGGYSRMGMDSRNIHPRSSAYEGMVARGGFGRSNYVVGG